MKKRIICLLMTVVLLISAAPAAAAASDFTDISDPETATAAAVLQGLGILSGRAEGKFEPNATLTRAEVCRMIVCTMGLSNQIDTHARKTLFSDVKPGAWYTGCVNLAYDKGIISGYGNGKFGPNDTITYGQFATIVLRMLDYSSKDVGTVWPRDFTAYCADLGLSDGLKLGDNDPIPRGNAALILYRAMKETPNGGARAFYYTINGVASAQDAILLSVNAANGGSTGLVMACTLGTSASVEYFSQKNTQSGKLEGMQGMLLLDSAGKTLGFIPESKETEDLVLSSAKVSGITASDGSFRRITGSAKLIIGEDVYVWNTNGYLQIASYTGRTARLYYDDDGAVLYIRIASGSSAASTETVVAETNSPLTELKRKLGVGDDCAVLKNGSPAAGSDLAKYDVAYFDSASGTLCVSDYRVTAYLESASPALDGAESITVAGCTLPVLESAWDSLANCALGKKVTLLLTDDGKVASAMSLTGTAAEMYGVLSADGKCVTLCGSGITLTAETVSADAKLYGSLVKVNASAKDTLTCSAWAEISAAGKTLDLQKRTLGSISLAPACAIYENTGSGYVYSLAGVQGASSADFAEIKWTNTLSGSSISWYHANEAGEIDILLLKDVTGNCYSYGKLTYCTGSDGIMTGTTLSPSSAVKVTNAANNGAGTKYLCAKTVVSGTFGGAALRAFNERYLTAVSVVTLASGGKTAGDALFQSGGDWFAVVKDYEIPVSESVQVYIAATGQWLEGETGIRTAVSTGADLQLYYDRSFTTGAQVRVIVAE